MTNLENLKKLAEGLGADASGAETNAAAIGVIAEVSKVITEKLDLSGFGKMTKLAEDKINSNFSGGTIYCDAFDLTNCAKLIFTVVIDLTGTATDASFTPELHDNTNAKIMGFENIVDEDGAKTYEVDCTNLAGYYKIAINGGGNGYFTAKITDIKGFSNIHVDNVVDALNYLLSLHD